MKIIKKYKEIKEEITTETYLKKKIQNERIWKKQIP